LNGKTFNKKALQRVAIMDKTQALEEIKTLVEKYQEAAKEGRISKYNEEMTKKDFILPLFHALGWKTDDSREVTAEEKISKKRVDYGFRINGISKFFLEAKSFKEDLDDRKFIEQAISYAWHKGCTWAILTNFEKLKIFNAEVKVSHPWLSQFKSLHCSEFVSKFEELLLLSRDSFENHLLDLEAEKWGKKAKKTAIDKQLLDDFTHFRDILSRNITKLNAHKNLNEEELDESVQRLLDRLIFIRNCEDRELEPKTLVANYREWESKGKGHLIKSLRETFVHFDNEYNSKIFAKHLCDDLDVDNEVLREVIEGLYTTKDNEAYDFAIIDADILGTIYEQYLGHILRKTEKRAKVTENHAHRKEQGIYYTPTYIVKYIVNRTLGDLLKNKKIDVQKIRVLDPACGSGSFLIKAFDLLNDYYKEHDENYKQTQLDLESGIPFKTKSRILQNNIFGADLDKQAVEIAQLNLLLKIAEKGHRLPLLEQNIKKGNSIVDDEKIAGSAAFNWNQEFKTIMDEGGFDVVIGNPPYVRQEELSEIKPYLQANYETYQGTADLFVYFFEKELKLLKENGYFGMIVSSKWLRAGYGKNLRKFLSQFWIEELIDFGDLKVFADATIYPCIIIIKKIKKQNPRINICNIETLNFGSLEEYIKKNSYFVNQSDLSEKEWNIQKREGNELVEKIRNSGVPIEKYVGTKIYRGLLTGFNEAFIIDEKKRDEFIREDPRNEDLIKPFLTGAEIKRYKIKPKGNYIILTKIGVEIEKYPTIYEHLNRYRQALEKRWDKGNYWYELRACAYYDTFAFPKIVWGNLATKSSFSIDEKNGFYVNNPACILPTNSRYVLGVLNSKVMSYFLKSICAERQGGFIEQKPVYVSQVPIKKPTNAQENEITQLVDKMLQLNEKLVSIGDKLTDEKSRIEKEVKETDERIDTLVFEIYGITNEAKKIIESSSQ
jgi:type I restriction-modification system DNA methylase subunit